jgi:hypothetical protein
MRFQRVRSGNPAGRPRGVRNKSAIVIENLAHADAETVARMLTAMTKGSKT